MSTLVTTNLKNPSNPGNNLVLEANGSVLFSAGTATVPSISFTGDLNTGIYSPGADQVAISTGGSGRLFVDASGRVGVGSAPSVGNGIHATINTNNYGTALVLQNANVNGWAAEMQFLGITTTDTQAKIGALATGPGTNSGALAFYTANAGSYLERLRITSAGLVGIGTSSPVAPLHVSGSAVFARLTDTQAYSFGTSGPVLDLTGNDSSGANTLFVRVQGSPANGGPDRGFLNVLTRLNGVNTSTLQVGTGFTADVLVPNGRLGIGTTSPGYALHVSGTGAVSSRTFATDATGDASFFVQNDGNGICGPLVYGSTKTAYGALASNETAFYSNRSTTIMADGGSAVIKFATGGNTERARIDSSGNVGIGTSSPGAPLDVVTGSSGAIFRFSTASTNLQIIPEAANGNVGIRFAANSGAAPNLQFRNDAGSNLVTITNGGNVGIGTTSPSQLLTLQQTSAGAAVDCVFLNNSSVSANTAVGISFGPNVSNTVDRSAVIRGINESGGSGNATGLQFLTNANGATPTEKARIDSSGRLLVGTSSARSNFLGSNSAAFQVEGNLGVGSVGQMISHVYGELNALGGPYLVLGKHRSGSIGGTTLVANNDQLGAVAFTGADGTSFLVGAQIQAFVDGTPGANDMPGRLVFSTTADGASFPTERLRITSAGLVGIGTSSPASLLSVVRAAEGTSLEALRLVNESPNQRSTSSVYIGMYGSNEAYERARILCGNPTDFDGNNGFLSFWTRGSNTLSERLRITSAGLVGIGTSSPGQNITVQSSASGTAPTFKLQNPVDSNSSQGAADNLSAGQLLFGATGAYPLTAKIESVYNADASFGRSAKLIFSGANGSGTLTERLTIDESGRVGIGTTSPGTNIDVRPGSVDGASLRVRNSPQTDGSPNDIIIGVSAPAIYGVAYIDTAKSGVAAVTPLSFRIDGTERARIDSSGRLLVGTSSGSYKFQINALGSAGFVFDDTTGAIANTFGTGGNLTLRAQVVSSVGGGEIYLGGSTRGDNNFNSIVLSTANTERMKIDSSGRVGIGTTSPGNANTTQVSSDGDGIRVQYANTPTAEVGPRLIFGHNTNNGTQQIFSAIKSLMASGNDADWSSHLGFYTGGSSLTERIRIPAQGGLSVGSSVSPNALTQSTGIRLGGSTIASHNFTNVTTSPVTIANGVGIGGLAFVQAYNTSNGSQYTGLVMWRSGVVAVVFESNSLGFGLTYSVSGSTLLLQTASGTITGSVITFAS